MAVVTLNRPERMNSMAFEVMVPLKGVLEELNYDNSVRAVVLTGAGRGFSSGADHKSAGFVPNIAGLTRPTFALRSMEVLEGFSRPGIELTKRTLWTGLDAASLEGHMQAEGLGQPFVRLLTANFEEAVAARAEKRSPAFTDDK